MKILKIAAAIALCAPALTASGAMPMRSAAVSEIAQYVYPANRPAEASLEFMPDGSGYVVRSDDGKQLKVLNINTGAEESVLMDLTHTRETTLTDFEGFRLSPDASKILLWRNSKSIYRRSFEAEYYVYEVRTRLLKPLSRQFAAQREPLFSPDSRMVAFVAGGNIYAAKLDYGTEVPVTTDGSPDGTLYGATDWTYEEEFGITSAMSWAPDNLNLCYLSFDQADVPEYTLPVYRGTCDPRDQYELYPGIMSWRYPVAGKPNSRVRLHSYDVETRKTKDIDLPGNPEYIPRISYGPAPEKLIVATLNRNQNHYEIFAVNPKSTVCKTVYSTDSRAWIEPAAYETLWLGKDYFVVAEDSDGWTRYTRWSYSGASMGAASAPGVDATDFYGADAAGNLYYQAAAPTPMDRTIYRMDARRGTFSAIGRTEGTSSATFAPGMGHMLLSYSNTDTPPVYTLNKADGRELRVIQDNAGYASRTLPLKAPKEFFTMRSGSTELNGYIVKPRDFDPSRRYPVVMTQYSGPGSQSVLHKWTLDWEDYFASKGLVVVCVDGRGTGGRGYDFRTCVYRDLGRYETEDQLAAARYAASLPYVDPSAIGICGWSYGGYETLMAASADGAPYAAAVAIAPVTDWRFYDTVYTERYMLTPQQNESGYNSSSALRRATSLACPLLMMYGTLDDNVHPANTLQYVSTLQSSGIFCDMFVFPNMNHSINGCNARAVVYGRMYDYFASKLK